MRPLPLVLAAMATLTAGLPAQAAAPAVQIVKIYYDSPGTDRRANASLNAEYIVIKNTTTRAIDLARWSIRDKTGYRHEFGADQILRAGKKLTLRTGAGNSGTSTVFWGRTNYVWNNDKDTAYVRNPAGRLIDSCSYNSTRADYKNCL